MKTGLVLEGGGLRGAYTAGALKKKELALITVLGFHQEHNTWLTLSVAI